MGAFTANLPHYINDDFQSLLLEFLIVNCFLSHISKFHQPQHHLDFDAVGFSLNHYTALNHLLFTLIILLQLLELLNIIHLLITSLAYAQFNAFSFNL
jgi:hypothetical protein